MHDLGIRGASAAHQRDAAARDRLRRAAADSGLSVHGGGLTRSSSRFCLGIEHGDYNGTDLFGVGTDRFLWIAWRPNDRGAVRCFSANEAQDGVVGRDVSTAPEPAAVRAQHGWGRFVHGAVGVLRRHGVDLRTGIDAVVFGDIPGGGMSRSAALSINLLLVLAAANGHAFADPLVLAGLAQALENEYLGSPCGLLDQVMIACARRDTGVLFAPRTRTVAHVPLGGDRGRLRFLSLDTGRARHGLQNATYPVRRRECEEFAALLAPEFGIRCLADVRTTEQFLAIERRHAAAHPEGMARLRYLFAAGQRFPALLQAWRNGDLAALGAAFRADGIGLRDDYRISGPELDSMCAIASRVPGVLGERMLGGGDCGTAGALALPDSVAAVRAAVAREYPLLHPRYAPLSAVHECATADGIAFLPPL